MHKEKVSAIITTHNRLNYLKKAVESVMNQTYNNIEIIVVDDGSSDDTKKYCISMNNIKYIYIPPKEHKNGNYARNLGIKASNGKYIAFLDDDDEWLNDKIEKQINKICEDKRYGVVYTGALVEVNDGEYFYKRHIKKECYGDCSKKSLYTVFATTSTMLFKKEALFEVGLFDENVNFWQETELMIRISQKYYVAALDESLIIYREKLNDPSKLTNNLNGFVQAVEYINIKHKDLIDKLDNYHKKKRYGMILQDLANRCTILGMNLKSRKYLFKLFLLFPSVKKFAKFILNYTSPTQVKMKMFTHNLKGKNK